MFRKIAFLLLLNLAPLGLFSQNAKEQLMPIPQQITWGSQRFNLDQSFHVVFSDLPDSRAHKAVVRFLRRLNDRTHLMTRIDPVLKSGDVKGVSLDVSYQRVGNLLPGEDESYELNVTGDRVTLSATTDIGVLYGLETFLQLVSSDSQGYFIPGVSIKDRPRFPWRGLLIDVCRHWSPIEVIKRNIDGMCMMKMNVLHLHLTEDQGFRIESKKLPKLHLM
ncbi:MAG: family 20 glycosylhydrolase, partial [Bacteroidota bacterium]